MELLHLIRGGFYGYNHFKVRFTSTNINQSLSPLTFVIDFL